MGIDTVFHLAGIAHDSAKKDNQYQAVNVRATLQLAELAVTSSVQRFVFLSSVKAGGNLLNGSCMTESDQIKPEGIYGKTKREAEEQVEYRYTLCRHLGYDPDLTYRIRKSKPNKQQEI